jgi:hypothetical protein
MVDHAELQFRDDIIGIEPVCCRGGLFFSHCVPWSISNTDRRHLIITESAPTSWPGAQFSLGASWAQFWAATPGA